MTVLVNRPGNERIRVNVLRVTFLLLLPAVVFTRSAWLNPEWVFEIMESTGIALLIGGVLGRFWAILYIGGRKNHMVMQDGPYSICRHPLYLFSTVATLGFGMMLGSLVLTAVLGGLVLLILSYTARREEAWLRQTYGAAYADYAARVPMILPDVRRFRTEDSVTFSVAQLRRNLNDALVFLSLIPLAEFMEWLKETGTVPTYPLW
jgi:protein-S-isoprenylcysteine O-methyltransferase Ste14